MNQINLFNFFFFLFKLEFFHPKSKKPSIKKLRFHTPKYIELIEFRTRRISKISEIKTFFIEKDNLKNTSVIR